MRILELCAGYGGLGLGVRIAIPWARVVGVVERQAYCASVLMERMGAAQVGGPALWPDVESFAWLLAGRNRRRLAIGDPRGSIDLITAGIPCQPFSQAGRRRGMADSRWLWRPTRRIIALLRPRYFLLENTPGLLSSDRGGLSERFSGTWTPSGMTRSGIAFRLPSAARITSALGCGSWPTPKATDARGGSSNQSSYANAPERLGLARLAKKMLPTPQAADGTRKSLTMMRGNPTLLGAVALLPTPRAEDSQAYGSHRGSLDSLLAVSRAMLPSPQANDWKSGTGHDHASRKQTPQLRHVSGGMLNPRPVEWMMYLPRNWVQTGTPICHTHRENGSPAPSQTEPSNCTHSEMESYLSNARMHLSYLLAARVGASGMEKG